MQGPLRYTTINSWPVFDVWLARLHAAHHADPDFDTTTGIRFHPLEIVLSMLVKYAAIIVLGAPAMAVLLFELLLNLTALFNHGNVRLPAPIERVLRWLVVTPDMHRVHHSIPWAAGCRCDNLEPTSLAIEPMPAPGAPPGRAPRIESDLFSGIHSGESRECVL